MGVRGLKGFLKANRSFWDWQELNDRTLVIDANNLFVTLYRQMYLKFNRLSIRRDDLYGGDMVAYAKLMRDFFNKLAQCNIKPVLVSHGTVPLDRSPSNTDRLFLQAEAKAVERFRSTRLVTEVDRGDRLCMSTCLNLVFKMVVDELQLDNIFTAYADISYAAKLANELKCPVVSNNSAFAIMPLDEGWIHFDDILQEDLHKSPCPSDTDNKKLLLNCPIFKQSKLLAQISGLKQDLLPLLGGLLRSTYGDGSPSDHLLYPISGSYHGPLNAKSFAHRRIANLLTWLATQRTPESAVGALCKKDATSMQTIKESIEGYVSKHTDSRDIIKDLELIYPASDYSWTNESEQPARYIASLVKDDSCYPSLLDIVFQKPLLENAVVDDLQLPPSGQVRLRPISVVVALMRPKSQIADLTATGGDAEPDDDTCRNSSAPAWKLDVYNRGSSFELSKCEVEALDELDGFGSLRGIHIGDVIQMDTDKKRQLVVATFRCDEKLFDQIGELAAQIFSGSFKQDAQICFMLIRFCAIQSKVKSMRSFVEAMIIILLHYNNEPAIDDDVGKAQLAASAVVADDRQESHLTNGRPHPKFRRIMHLMSQLSVAYCSFGFLSTLLRNPLQLPQLQNYLNCPLIYKLTCKLSSGELDLRQELAKTGAQGMVESINKLVNFVVV